MTKQEALQILEAIKTVDHGISYEKIVKAIKIITGAALKAPTPVE